MIRLPRAKIEKAVCPEHDIVCNLYFDKVNERLIATDGMGMVVIPVKSSNDDLSGPIPIGAVKFARRYDGEFALNKTDQVHVLTTHGTLTWDRPTKRYCDLGFVHKALEKEGECTVISLDARRLFNLAKSLLDRPYYGCHPVILRIAGEKEAIIVRPYEATGDDRFGLLMPMKPRPE